MDATNKWAEYDRAHGIEHDSPTGWGSNGVRYDEACERCGRTGEVDNDTSLCHSCGR